MIQLIQDIDHTHDQINSQCHPRRDINSPNKGVVQSRKKKKEQQVKIPFSTPEDIYDANLINEELQQSFKQVAGHVILALRQRMRLSQDQVYMGVLGEDKSYLGRLYVDGGDERYQKQAITELFNEVHDKIVSQIQDEKYSVHKKIRITKDELRSGGNPKQFKQLKQKLKENLSSLKAQLVFDLQKIGQVSAFNPLQYAPNNQKTKKAEEFVKNIRKLQSADRKRRQEKKKQRQMLQVRSLQQKKQVQQKVKQQKHHSLIQKIKQKQQTKKMEQEKKKQQKQKFQIFLQQYNKQKPLYKKYQERFHKNFIVQENRKRLQALTKIRDQRQPIDILQIKDHAERYKQLMEEKADERQAAMQIVMKQRRRQKKKYYHGKFHNIIKKQEQERQQFFNDPKYDIEQLYKRRWQYAEMIRKNFMPKISAEKNKQLQDLLQKLRWSQRWKANSANKNYHEQGIRNLEKLHQLIAEMRAKGKVRISSPMQIQSTKPIYANYLESMRMDKQYSSRYNKSKTIDYSGQSAEFISMNASRMEREARRKQKFLSYADTIDIHQHLSQKKKIQDNYLESARMKLSLLSQIK